MTRIDDCMKFCTSKADLKNALDLMAYYGFCDIVNSSNNFVSMTASNTVFVLEYENADKEEVRITFNHIWIKDCSSIIVIDSDRYDSDLLFNEFGGVFLQIAFR